MGGGVTLDLGIYCLQFISLVFNNDMPEDIKATGELNQDGVDICTTANLCYSGLRSASIVMSGLTELPNTAYICGTKKMIEIPNFWCPTKLNMGEITIEEHLPIIPDRNATFNFTNSAGLAYEVSEARACILKGKIIDTS